MVILSTVPPRSGRPRNAEVDAAVLRATADLVGRHGYAGTTLDQVAAAAGVAKTTVYRRWTSKSALAVAALVDVLGVPPGREAAQSEDLREDLREGLREAIAWLAGRVGEPGVQQLLLGLLAEAGRDADVRAELRRLIRDPFQDRVVARWAVEPAAVDLAFDVVVGTVLHRLTTTGAVSPAVLATVADLAESLLLRPAS
ncbi:MAG: TetR family transcriptional regulator [Marmoricola sp.]|nr:TetR family transcriptional regulator [Marmoricola sp.]